MTYDLRLVERFTYHPPKDKDQIERYGSIRGAGLEFAKLLDSVCPSSAELTNAINMIDQAVMWANASIARNE